MALILVVDDDRPRSLQVGLRASGAGHEVMYAENVTSAIGHLLDFEPEIVFVGGADLSTRLARELDRLVGWDVTRPQIIITDDSNGSDQRQAADDLADQLNTFGVLGVPCDQRAIRSIINQALAATPTPAETVRLTVKVLTDPGPIIDLIEADPIVQLGDLAGGIEVLDAIIEHSGTRRVSGGKRRLADALTSWGSLRPADRLQRAHQLVVELINKHDSVSTALRLLARRIVDRNTLPATGSDPIK